MGRLRAHLVVAQRRFRRVVLSDPRPLGSPAPTGLGSWRWWRGRPHRDSRSDVYSSAHRYEHIRFQVHQFCRERRQFRVAALGRPEEDGKISPLLVSELIHCFNERGRRTRSAYCTAQNAYGHHSSIGWLSSCSGRPCCRSAVYHQGNKLAPSHVTPPGNGLMQGSNYSIIEPPSERQSWQDA